MNNDNSIRLLRELEGQCKLLISHGDTPQSVLSRLCNGHRSSKIDCPYLTCFFFFFTLDSFSACGAIASPARSKLTFKTLMYEF